MFICGLNLRSISLYAMLLYLIHRSLAALDGYAAGEDYPVYDEVPKGLSFTCQDKIPGYYADPDTQCQVWHWCVPSLGGNIMYSFVCAPGTVFNQRTRVCDWFFKVWHWCVPSLGGNIMYSFVCASGTVFNQRTRVCDWFFKVDCPKNEDLYKDHSGNYIAGKK